MIISVPPGLPAFCLDSEGYVTLWNDSCVQFSGIPAEQVLGTKEHWRAFYKKPALLLADELLADELPAEELPAEELPAKLPAEEVAERLSADKLSACGLSADQLSANELPLDKMPANRLPAKELSAEKSQLLSSKQFHKRAEALNGQEEGRSHPVLKGRTAPKQGARDGRNLLCLNNGQSYSGIIRVETCPPENMVWVHASRLYDENGKIAGVTEIFQPVVLSRFIQNSSLIGKLIDTFSVPVALVFDNKLHLVNKAFSQLMGFDSPEEMIGLSPDAYVAEEDKEKFLRLNANMHAGLVPGHNYHWKYKTRQGKTLYVIGQPRIFPWGSGNALLSTVTDETEAVLREQRLLEEQKRLAAENSQLLDRLSKRKELFLGTSLCMRNLMVEALKAAQTDSNIVITGETGTGKSLLARIIHDFSSRREKALVSVNCAAIPENLLETEFFGHMKGAFTGAHADKKGFMHAANGGTLFLDEVGELSVPMQIKLLNAIESNWYTPVGSTHPQFANVRLICATNRNLVQMMEEGKFRKDFFYRIFVIDLHIPPLRERKEDIRHLSQFLFQKFTPLDEQAPVPAELMERFLNYDWPGNIRQLQNIIMRYLATGNMPDFQKDASLLSQPQNEMTVSLDEPLEEAVNSVRRKYIMESLKKNNGNKILAARSLNMSIRSFHRYCAEFGLVRKLQISE